MIKGLSEKRRMPRLGKIRLGITVDAGNGKRPYPKAVDYFVCPPEVQKVHGAKPKELAVMLPLDDPEKVFPQAFKMYKASGLFCSGDGERARRWGDDGELKEIACPCPFLDSGDCKPLATLNILLPDVPGIGVWQINTSSERSITSINSSLEAFRQTFGGLAGIPFTLTLEPEEITRFDEKQGKRVKQTLFVLRLDSPFTMRQIVEWRSRTGAAVTALMPAPDTEAIDVIAHVVEDGPDPRALAAGTPTWDSSMCVATATKLGVAADVYGRYIVGVYSVEPGDLTDEQVAEQRDFLEKGTANATAGDATRQVIEKVARRVVDQKLTPKARGTQGRLA